MLFFFCFIFANENPEVRFSLELQGWQTHSGLDWQNPADLDGDDYNVHHTQYPGSETLPGLALQVGYRRFLVSLSTSLQTRYQGTHSYAAKRTYRTSSTIAIDYHELQYDSTLKRRDLDLVLGYVLRPHWLLLAGYKSIHYNEETRETQYLLSSELFGSEGPPAEQNYGNQFHDPSRQFDERYRYNGGFAGIGYITQHGSWHFSSHLVYAYLDGQTKFSSIGNQSGAGSEIELIDSQSSQAKGLGLTLSSSYAVNDWFSLLLAYKYQDYQASNSAGSAFPDFSANGLQAGFRIGW